MGFFVSFVCVCVCVFLYAFFVSFVCVCVCGIKISHDTCKIVTTSRGHKRSAYPALQVHSCEVNKPFHLLIMK